MFGFLSDELIINMFSFSNVTEVFGTCSLVCQKWKEISESELVVKGLADQVFGKNSNRKWNEEMSFKIQFVKLFRNAIEIKSKFHPRLIEAIGLELLCNIPKHDKEIKKNLGRAGGITIEEVSHPITLIEGFKNDGINGEDIKEVHGIAFCYINSAINSNKKQLSYLYQENAQGNVYFMTGTLTLPFDHFKDNLYWPNSFWEDRNAKILNHLSRFFHDQCCGNIKWDLTEFIEIDPKGKKVVYLTHPKN